MTRFKTEFKIVLSDFPEIVEEFMNNLRNSNSPFKDIDLDEIKWYYTWYLDYDNIDEDIESTRFILEYDERLKYELSKIKVSVTMKAGQFKRRDRVNSSVIPKDVEIIVDEVVRIMMMEEQRFFSNESVVKSIPPIENDNDGDSLVNLYKDYYKNVDSVDSDDYWIAPSVYEQEHEDEDVDYNYDLDTILDKISELGVDSLTNGEKEFLSEQ